MKINFMAHVGNRPAPGSSLLALDNSARRPGMELLGLRRKDLEPALGSRARVSEIPNRRRPLTIRMTWRLHEAPASLLDATPPGECDAIALGSWKPTHSIF